ncbi:MAG: DUF1573 domain-containing protein [Thermoanaerobaculia bacterium]
MKKIFFILLFFLSFYLPAQPIFYVEESTVHLGNVLQKAEVEGEFLIENRGNETLEFTEVVPYCNCTILSMPSKLPPGSKEKLIFTITPKIAEGDWRTVIKITTNEPKDNIHRLTITMNVIPLLKFEPSPREAITLLPDENLDQIIKIKSPANLNFSILEFSVHPPEEVILENITPLGENISPGNYFIFKIRSLKPLQIGENYFNIKFKTNIENLPVAGYILKVLVKNYLWAEPETLIFNLTTKPGLLIPAGNDKVAYESPKKESNIKFKLNQKEQYKIIGFLTGWYQIQNHSNGLTGWVQWDDINVVDDGFSASTKIYSARDVPFKIKSIQCPEKFSCSYREEKGYKILNVYRKAPLENLKEEFGRVEVLTDHPKQEKLIIPLSEKKIQKYQDTKEKMDRKLRLNPKFQDKKLKDAQPKIKIGE